MQFFRNVFRIYYRQHKVHSQGQGLVEYALILGLAALAVIAIVNVMRPAIEDVFSRFTSNAPVAPPSLLSYTPPPTYTPIPTLDPAATNTPSSTPTQTATPGPTATATPTQTPTSTSTPTATATPVCLPYGPYQVPGRVQMENFVCGGPNVAFVDSTGDGGPGSGSHRVAVSTEGPDLGSVSGGYYLGWLIPNEWIVYDVNTLESRLYDIDLRVASANSNGRLHIDILRDGNLIQSLSSVTINSTGGDQTWGQQILPQIPLFSGSNQIRFVFETGGFNIDYFDVALSAVQPTPTNTATPTNTPTATPTNTPTATATSAPVQITLIDADFENDQDGFTYRDDTFYGTNRGYYARGNHRNNGGYTGDGLRIRIGNRNDNNINDMSGGYEATFTLPADAQVNVSFRYQLVMPNAYEPNECSEVLVSIDGQLYGDSGNNYVIRNCDGVDTGWQSFSFQTGQLTAGDHTLTIGGYNNRKTANNEQTTIYLDDVFAETN